MSARDELLREMTHNHLYMTDDRADELIDAFARELAERLREWGEGGKKRLAVDEHGVPLHRSPFFMWEDADTAADLIDPHVSAAPVRPDEEPTT